MVSVGKAVSTIGDYAFGLCKAIVTVESKNPEPPIMQNVFENETYLSGTLYVPQDAIPAYKEAEDWGNFMQIKAIGSVPTGVQEMTATNSTGGFRVDGDSLYCSGGVKVVSISGAIVSNSCGTDVVTLAKGVYIVIANGKSSKVIIK